MDAVIRFCFSGVNPDEIENEEEYARIYGQAKFIWDNITVAGAAKVLNAVS